MQKIYHVFSTMKAFLVSCGGKEMLMMPARVKSINNCDIDVIPLERPAFGEIQMLNTKASYFTIFIRT